jgi:hypothetical protein
VSPNQVEAQTRAITAEIDNGLAGLFGDERRAVIGNALRYLIKALQPLPEQKAESPEVHRARLAELIADAQVLA